MAKLRKSDQQQLWTEAQRRCRLSDSYCQGIWPQPTEPDQEHLVIQEAVESTSGRLSARYLHEAPEDGCTSAPEQPVGWARDRGQVVTEEGILRVDVPEYPDFKVREAIANTVAHRDWSLDGAKVWLFIFDDCLEIWSPGKLPPSITLRRLGFDQFSRKKVIARVLLELGYIEEVGLGIWQIHRLIDRIRVTRRVARGLVYCL